MENITSKLIDMANRDHERLMMELADERGVYNTGHMAAYIGILFKVTFANIEKRIGLDAARASFKYASEFMIDVMIDGAYDKENDKIK